MKQLRTLFLLFFSLFSLSNYALDTFEYKTEFEAFKNSASCANIFDENAPQEIRNIQAYIKIASQLSYLQRIANYPITKENPVIINAENMPKLYTYIDSACKSQQIATPIICIAQDMRTLNAGTFKVLTNPGSIIIYPQILLQTTDIELEAIIAHEIGHIKHQHVNKNLFSLGLSCLTSYFVLKTFLRSNYTPTFLTTFLQKRHLTTAKLWFPVGHLINKIIIGKRFEKQADEFAYKTMGKGAGIIKYFENSLQRKKISDDYYKKTESLLAENEKRLGPYDKIKLDKALRKANFNYLSTRLIQKILSITPLEEHPSDEARIKAAQDYLASQEQVQIQ